MKSFERHSNIVQLDLEPYAATGWGRDREGFDPSPRTGAASIEINIVHTEIYYIHVCRYY